MSRIKNEILTVINPFLIVLIPFFQASSFNYVYIDSVNLLYTFSITFAFAVTVFAGSYFFTRDLYRSLYFCLVLFFVACLSSYITNKASLHLAPQLYKYGIFPIIFWCLVSYLLYILTHKHLARNKAFSIFSFIFSCAFIAQQVPYLAKIHYHEIDSSVYSDVEKQYRYYDPVLKPNIVYIVPDRYTSNANLIKYFDFDNASFSDFLREKGFYVSDNQHANYTKTFASLASMLNMGYLDKALKPLGQEYSSFTPVFDLISDNQATRILKRIGYQYIHMGNWWQPTKTNKNANQSVTLNDGYSEFMQAYLAYTPFDFLNHWFNLRIASDQSCALLDKQMQAIDQAILNSEEKPVFVFWHLFTTHEPFIFNEDGSCADSPNWAKKTWRGRQETYLSHLKITNSFLERKINFIFDNSKRPVIIVIQADEGPLAWEMLQDKSNFNFWEASEEGMRLKYGMFNAIYLPSGNYRDFSKQISPVNNFRIIFNEMHDQKIPYLPHNFFAMKSEMQPLEFKDITPMFRENQ